MACCRSQRLWALALATLATTVIVGCRSEMYDQAKGEPLEKTDFFKDGMMSREPIEGTVARGELRENDAFHTGKSSQTESGFVEEFPMEITADVMKRGQEQFGVYCTPCHGTSGAGDGMIVKRGFQAPTSFHIQRLREAPPGYYVDVITNGFGAMYSYASRVRPADRWAITAYIRALQASQNATLEDVPAAERSKLEASN